MKAETLVVISTARGVAIDNKGATKLEMAEQAAWFRPGTSEGGSYRDGKVRWGGAQSTHVRKKATWSLAECAMAAKGLDNRFFLAMRFSFALDDSAIGPLRAALHAYGLREQERTGWHLRNLPDRPGRKTYLEDLVDLALLEDRQPGRFTAPTDGSAGRPPNMRPILMEVDPLVWRRKLSEPYENLVHEYRSWLAIGGATMQRRLREENAA